MPARVRGWPIRKSTVTPAARDNGSFSLRGSVDVERMFSGAASLSTCLKRGRRSRPRMVQQRGRGSFGCWPVGRSWPVSRAPPVAGVRRRRAAPLSHRQMRILSIGLVGLAPHRRVVGCVRRCRTLVSIPGRSAASAVQADIGHHPRRARPVPATGAPRGGVGGFVRRCGGCVAAAAGSRAVGRRWAWR